MFISMKIGVVIARKTAAKQQNNKANVTQRLHAMQCMCFSISLYNLYNIRFFFRGNFRKQWNHGHNQWISETAGMAPQISDHCKLYGLHGKSAGFRFHILWYQGQFTIKIHWNKEENKNRSKMYFGGWDENFARPFFFIQLLSLWLVSFLFAVAQMNLCACLPVCVGSVTETLWRPE